jgi:hypothetical protein
MIQYECKFSDSESWHRFLLKILDVEIIGF